MTIKPTGRQTYDPHNRYGYCLPDEVMAVHCSCGKQAKGGHTDPGMAAELARREGFKTVRNGSGPLTWQCRACQLGKPAT